MKPVDTFGYTNIFLGVLLYFTNEIKLNQWFHYSNVLIHIVKCNSIDLYPKMLE